MKKLSEKSVLPHYYADEASRRRSSIESSISKRY